MPFVVDASVALAWCFVDEEQEYARRVLRSLMDDMALAPAIWCLEVANGIVKAERRGRISAADLGRITDLLLGLPITIEDATIGNALGVVLDLARSEGLTSYDASYLALAMREGLPLASQDENLARAAARVGVTLLRPRGG